MKRSYKLQKRWVRVDFFLLSFIKKLIIGKTILFFLCPRSWWFCVRFGGLRGGTAKTNDEAAKDPAHIHAPPPFSSSSAQSIAS